MGTSRTIQYILDPKKAQVSPISSKTILMNYTIPLDRAWDRRCVWETRCNRVADHLFQGAQQGRHAEGDVSILSFISMISAG